jgi:hypothetical protein
VAEGSAKITTSRLATAGFEVEAVDIRQSLLGDERRRYGLSMELPGIDAENAGDLDNPNARRRVGTATPLS